MFGFSRADCQKRHATLGEGFLTAPEAKVALTSAERPTASASFPSETHATIVPLLAPNSSWGKSRSASRDVSGNGRHAEVAYAAITMSDAEMRHRLSNCVDIL